MLHFGYPEVALAFHVRDETTDTLVRRLAEQRGVGLTEAVRLAVEAELERRNDEFEVRDRRARAILGEIDALPRTGLKADKAFFDDMSGD